MLRRLVLALHLVVEDPPLWLLLMGSLGLAWLLGFVGFCQAVGDRLPFEERPHRRWLAFLVGVLLLTFFGSLPGSAGWWSARRA